MSARYVSSTLIKNVKTSTGKQIAIDVVDKTTAWVRPPSFPVEQVKDKFAKVAADNLSQFKPEVVKIAMKESEHVSESDSNEHYTAYGLDKNDNVVDVQHLKTPAK